LNMLKANMDRILREKAHSLKAREEACRDDCEREKVELNDVIDSLRHQIQECTGEYEREKEGLQREILALKEQIQVRGRSTARASSQPKRKKSRSRSKSPVYVDKQHEDQALSLKIDEFIQKSPHSNLLKRDKGNRFLFGTRRIAVYLRFNELHVRVGGGYVTLQEFCEKYHHTELIHMAKVHLKNEPEEKKHPSAASSKNLRVAATKGGAYQQQPSQSRRSSRASSSRRNSSSATRQRRSSNSSNSAARTSWIGNNMYIE